MAFKKTLDEFIVAAEKVHDNKYKYLEYNGAMSNVKIYCNTCNEIFYQRASSHLQGKGCRKCSYTTAKSGKGIKLTTSEYIDKLKSKYGDLYGYEKVEYKSRNHKVIIVCRVHGDIEVNPDNFLGGKGCSLCSGHFKKDTEYFINKSIEKHGNRYDYSKSVYVNTKTKLIIICKEHGDFEQRPSHHYKGHNCPKCGKIENDSKQKTKTTEEFLSECIAMHGDRYVYDKTKYIRGRDKVTVTCRIHGDFLQRPDHHSKGSNCPKCIDIGYMKSDFVKASLNKGRDGTGNLYIIEFKSDEEHFYKIGIAVSMNTRLRAHKRTSYECNVITIINDDAAKIYEAEKKFLQVVYNQKYIPLSLDSGGINECFKHDDINSLVEMINDEFK